MGVQAPLEDRILDNSNNGKPKYEGASVYMDGKEWIVPALSLRQFRDYHQTLSIPYNVNDDYAAYLNERLPAAYR